MAALCRLPRLLRLLRVVSSRPLLTHRFPAPAPNFRSLAGFAAFIVAGIAWQFVSVVIIIVIIIMVFFRPLFSKIISIAIIQTITHFDILLARTPESSHQLIVQQLDRSIIAF